MDALTALVGNNSWLLILLLVWVLPWKGVALWKAAMCEDKWWFIIIFIVNTFGILDIFYIFFIARRHDDMHTHLNSDVPLDGDMLGSGVGIDEQNEVEQNVNEVEDGNESESVNAHDGGGLHENISEVQEHSEMIAEPEVESAEEKKE